MVESGRSFLKFKMNYNISIITNSPYNICEICHKKYYRKRSKKTNKLESLYNFKKRQYCSKECYWKSLKEKMLGLDNPHYKERIIKKCKNCEKKFEVLPSRNFRKFCSPKCFRDYNLGKPRKGKHLKGEGHPSFGKHPSKNTKEKMKIAKLKNPTRYWLNKERPELRKTDIEKSKWREFRGQLSTRTEYKQWVRAVFEKDDYTCQKCKIRGERLNAHHIFNFRDYFFKGLKKENGITLCETCHRNFHKRYGNRNNTEKQIKEFLRKDILDVTTPLPKGGSFLAIRRIK